MNQGLEDSWREGGKTPNDPGLRESYTTLPRAPIRLIVLPLGKAINHGGMTRIADAYRIERVDFSKEPDGAIDFAGQRGTKGWQPWRWVDSATAIQEAKSEGYTVAALTLSDRAMDVAKVAWQFPLALVLGEEAQGIPPEIEALCDLSIAIPLYGLVTSMNVVTASAIALEYAVRQYSHDHPDFTPARAASRDLLGK